VATPRDVAPGKNVTGILVVFGALAAMEYRTV
jgi:hypothetical protein